MGERKRLGQHLQANLTNAVVVAAFVLSLFLPFFPSAILAHRLAGGWTQLGTCGRQREVRERKGRERKSKQEREQHDRRRKRSWRPKGASTWSRSLSLFRPPSLPPEQTARERRPLPAAAGTAPAHCGGAARAEDQSRGGARGIFEGRKKGRGRRYLFFFFCCACADLVLLLRHRGPSQGPARLGRGTADAWPPLPLRGGASDGVRRTATRRGGLCREPQTSRPAANHSLLPLDSAQRRSDALARAPHTRR